MKYLIIFLFAISLQAQNVFEVQKLIENDIYKNSRQIQIKAESLNDWQRYVIYDGNKKNATGAVALNLILGFGIGSFSQGDNINGILQLSSELIGYGAIAIYSYYTTESIEKGYGFTRTTHEQPSVNVAYAGVSLLLLSKIIGIIAPIGYADTYNEHLKILLGMNLELTPTNLKIKF